MNKSLISLIILACILMITGCDKSNNPSGNMQILAKIKLVNSENEPLVGYKATIFPLFDIESLEDNEDKSSTVISFTIPQTSHIKIEIFDYYDNKLETLYDDIMSVGQSSLVYSPESAVTDGIYRVEFTRSKDGEILDFISQYIYKYSKSQLGNNDFTTDENGEFVETNRYCFPSFYFTGQLDCYTYYGEFLGKLSFTHKACVKISNNEGLVKTATFNLIYAPSVLELNWDEMTLEVKNSDNNELDNSTIGIDSASLLKDNDNGDNPPSETEFMVYPNPFN